MRQPHTRTLALEEVFGLSISQYAILSHIWGEDEIPFSQIQDKHDSLIGKGG